MAAVNKTELAKGLKSSQNTVTIPIEKLFELLLPLLGSNIKKSPLTRTKSDPIAGVNGRFPKRQSNPEIFIFPDLAENQSSGSTTPHVSSQSLSVDGRKDSSKSGESVSRSECRGFVGDQKEKDYLERAEILPLSLSYEERNSSNHGVSEVYFKNIVNELVKTKKYLEDLQKKHKILQQEKWENELLKRENHGLRFTAQHLQREHRSQAEQIKKLKQKLNAYKPPGMNESFELGSSDEADCSERGAQTEPMLIGHSNSMVKMLQQRMDDLKKENCDLIQQYGDLKNNVKILNSCLHDEKHKNTKKDKELHVKEAERRKLFGQLSRRRQEYDELYQDYKALKKRLNLYEDDTYSSDRSRHSSRSSSHTAQSYNSQGHPNDQILLNIPASDHSSLNGDRQHILQNNLSYTDDNERAPSNIPHPYTRKNSHDAPHRPHASELNQTSTGQGTMETQPHEELICPTCLQTFQEDHSFIHHLTKCLLY